MRNGSFWTSPAAVVILAPILVVLWGVGVWANQLAHTWTPGNTDSLVNGAIMMCGLGLFFPALILAILVGIPYAIRLFREINEDALSMERRFQMQQKNALPKFDVLQDVPPPMQQPNHLLGEVRPQLKALPAQDPRFGRDNDAQGKPW